MNEVQSEHRGWEIESSYSQHYLDDADFVFDGEEERAGWFWGIAVLGVALAAGVWLLGKWLEPPVVNFAPPIITTVPGPRVEVAIHDRDFLFPPGYTLTCIAIDGKAMTVKPNWGNPACKGPR